MAKYDKNIGENLYHQAKRLINKSINSKTINSLPAYISKKNERPLKLPSAKN